MNNRYLHIFLVGLFTFLSFALPAQVSKVEAMLLENKKQVVAFNKSGILPGRKQVLLSTGFNNAAIANTNVIRELQGKVIESIDLVYTQYAESPDFDQASLNRQRLNRLKTQLPSAFQQPYIKWTLVAQQPKTTPEARALFHGFAITYRDVPTEETMKEEIAYLEAAVSKVSTPLPDKTASAADSASGWDFTATVKVEKNDTLLRKTVEDAGMTLVDTLYDTGLFGRRIFYIYSTDTKTLEGLFTGKPEDVPYGLDSVVTRVLDRNLQEWKDMLIISDLTGSMSPYSAQLLAWYRLHAGSMPVKRFVFFNDGNRTPDADKKPGETGGIYAGPGGTIKEVMSLAEKTMRNGGGGDIPENNIEAVLYAIDECPDCGAVVMVADNLASPRDLKFVSKIRKPVKIIVCGAQTGINPDYLDIAKATGGSVHLMEKDIKDISSVKEGEKITIGKQVFRLYLGHFVAE